jgi:hypothetical protein
MPWSSFRRPSPFQRSCRERRERPSTRPRARVPMQCQRLGSSRRRGHAVSQRGSRAAAVSRDTAPAGQAVTQVSLGGMHLRTGGASLGVRAEQFAVLRAPVAVEELLDAGANGVDRKGVIVAVGAAADAQLPADIGGLERANVAQQQDPRLTFGERADRLQEVPGRLQALDELTGIGGRRSGQRGLGQFLQGRGRAPAPSSALLQPRVVDRPAQRVLDCASADRGAGLRAACATRSCRRRRTPPRGDLGTCATSAAAACGARAPPRDPT